jgi:hypothetical protein
MGHKSISSTEVYTKVKAIELYYRCEKKASVAVREPAWPVNQGKMMQLMLSLSAVDYIALQ